MASIADNLVQKPGALRLSRGTAVTLADNPFSDSGLSDGFTVEAWVNLASMEPRVGFFPEAQYGGTEVRLKPGRYDVLEQFRTGKAPGSFELPEGFELVVFTEPGCRGSARILRDDEANSCLHPAVKSALVIDRRHRRQNHVVMFDGAHYTGNAIALRAGESAEIGPSDTAVLERLGSLLLPPGLVAHMGGASLAGDVADAAVLFEGDAVGILRSLRALPDPGDEVLWFTDFGFKGDKISIAQSEAQWPSPAPRSVRVPDGLVALVFEKPNFRGEFRVVADDQSALDLPWPIGSTATLAVTPGEELAVVRLGNFPSRNMPPGSAVGLDWHFFDDAVFLVLPRRRFEFLGTLNPEEPDDPLEAAVALVGPGATHLQHPHYAHGANPVAWLGVLGTKDGSGLEVRLEPSRIAHRGLVPRYGNQPLETNRWHHIALSWAKERSKLFLDGREVGERLDPFLLDRLKQGPVLLGSGVRGALSRVRVWVGALDLNGVRRVRFVDAPEGADPPHTVLLAGPSDGPAGVEVDADAGSHWIPADLPPNPHRSVLAASTRRAVTAETTKELAEARDRTAEQLRRGHERKAALVAVARKEARVRAQLAAIEQVSFARGSDVVDAHFDRESGRFVGAPARFSLGGQDHTELLATDTALGGTTQSPEVFAAVAFPDHAIVKWSNGTSTAVVADLPAAPYAVAVDAEASEPRVFWIEEGGTLCTMRSDVSDSRQVLRRGLPSGRGRAWDLAVAHVGWTVRLAWSNGWEIWTAAIESDALADVSVAVPHALSPHPLGVTLTEDGRLVWVDREHEVVRVLLPESSLPTDLYTAARPAPATAVGLVAGSASNSRSTAVYWVSADRRRLEVPVLDSPGLFLDLRHRLDRPAPFHQHVPILHGVRPIGARWEASPVLTIDLAGNYDVRFGPFDNEDSTAKVKMRFRPTGPSSGKTVLLIVNEGFWSPYGSYQRAAACVYMNGSRLQLSVDQELPVETVADLSVGGWNRDRTVEVRFAPGRIGLWLDEEQKKLVAGGRLPSSWTVTVLPIVRTGEAGGNHAVGELFEVDVESGTDETPVGHLRMGQTEGTVDASRAIWQESPSTSAPPDVLPMVLAFREEGDSVELDPLQLDLRAGLTVAAHLSRSRASTAPATLLVLATTEHRDRIAFTVDADGLPGLSLHVDGQALTPKPEAVSSLSVHIGRPAHVCAVLGPAGHLSLYVDGELVQRQVLETPPHWADLFTTNQVGSPPPARAEVVRSGAMLHHDDPPPPLAQFLGNIHSIQAWNTALSPDSIAKMAAAPQADPELGPSDWDRGLVVDETRHRFLHAAPLDGSGPADALMPLELDGGLAIVTKLTEAHASLVRAHADKEAADRQAAAEKAAAIAEANRRRAEANSALDAVHARAERQHQEALEEAARKRAQAVAKKEAADRQAAEQLARGRSDKAKKEAEARSKANIQLDQARTDKRRRVAKASEDLQSARSRKSSKQDELASKR